MNMKSGFKEIFSCEVCDSNELTSVLDLGLLPLCDDLVKIKNARSCREFPTEVLLCPNCKTAHQRYQVDKNLLFTEEYHYRARFTKDVTSGMSELVASCKEHCGNISEMSVLDIGCNDGSLLNIFKNEGLKTIGVEPTNAYLDAEKNNHLVYNSFLTKDFVTKFLKENNQPDIITFTNVFAHIDDLKSLIQNVKMLAHKETCIIIENHYLGSILDHAQFDTFYHEHPRSYSFASFQYIAKSLGMQLKRVNFPNRYGGNIRVFIDNKIDNVTNLPNLDEIHFNEEKFYNKFEQLNQDLQNWRDRKKVIINDLVKIYGKIAAKAFPGRASILIRFLELDEMSISAVYEKNGSKKIGHYVPGTRIPILSDNELFKNNGSEPLLNLAWHIPNEIREYLHENGIFREVIDIISDSDLTT